jgi:adenosylcobinamide-phosphate synthase
MVPSGIILTVLVLFTALVVDRLIGDPRSVYHPVAVLGRFIGWWGKPEYYPPRFQRLAGILLWGATAGIFTLPFFIFAALAPDMWYLVLAPFFLKCCFAWRSLEEHTLAVITAVNNDIPEGREKVRMLVSRNTADLDREHILSAAYESMTENITDSIISPLFYFSVFGPVFGLGGAAAYRASNTMDAMLGYRDEREKLGWFSARIDDVLNYVPARVSVVLLLVYFFLRGRFVHSLHVLQCDSRKRPGFNGGIVMAVMAGGTGVLFEKPGVYKIGTGEKTFDEAGFEILYATRFVTLAFTGIAGGTLILLGSLINSTGI